MSRTVTPDGHTDCHSKFNTRTRGTENNLLILFCLSTFAVALPFRTLPLCHQWLWTDTNRFLAAAPLPTLPSLLGLSPPITIASPNIYTVTICESLSCQSAASSRFAGKLQARPSGSTEGASSNNLWPHHRLCLFYHSRWALED